MALVEQRPGISVLSWICDGPDETQIRALITSGERAVVLDAGHLSGAGMVRR